MYPQNKLWWDRLTDRPVATHPKADPFLLGEFTLPTAAQGQQGQARLRAARRARAHLHAGMGRGHHRHRRRHHPPPAHEMGIAARDQKIELPIAWTDCWGKEHQTVTGNPVAFHAMRGLAAHERLPDDPRAGHPDEPARHHRPPGGFRHKSPFPRAIPPSAKPPSSPAAIKPNTPLAGLPLGWPASPDDLFLDDDGQPVRLDKGFSWEHPLSVHGLMHNAITNAWRGDPYRSTR